MSNASRDAHVMLHSTMAFIILFCLTTSCYGSGHTAAVQAAWLLRSSVSSRQESEAVVPALPLPPSPPQSPSPSPRSRTLQQHWSMLERDIVQTAEQLRDIVAAHAGSGQAVSLRITAEAPLMLGGLPFNVSGCNISIQSEADVSTIDGENRSRIFVVGANGALELNRITLQNGRDVGTQHSAGAIYCYEGSAVLRSSTVTGCTAFANTDAVGGIFVRRGSIVLSGSSILSCSATAQSRVGGGLSVYYARVTLTDSQIVNCSARSRFLQNGNVVEAGGGIFVNTGGVAMLHSSLVADCDASIDQDAAGGLYINGIVNVVACMISKCHASTPHMGSQHMPYTFGAAGGFFVHVGSLVVNNSQLVGCTASQAMYLASGGLTVVGGDVVVSQVSIVSCAASVAKQSAAGGAAIQGGSVRFDNSSTIINCTANALEEHAAGGIFLSGGATTLRVLTIAGCSAIAPKSYSLALYLADEGTSAKLAQPRCSFSFRKTTVPLLSWLQTPHQSSKFALFM